MAKVLLSERVSITEKAWKNNINLIQHGISLDPIAMTRFLQHIDLANNQTELLAAEGHVGQKVSINNLHRV